MTEPYQHRKPPTFEDDQPKPGAPAPGPVTRPATAPTPPGMPPRTAPAAPPPTPVAQPSSPIQMGRPTDIPAAQFPAPPTPPSSDPGAPPAVPAPSQTPVSTPSNAARIIPAPGVPNVVVSVPRPMGDVARPQAADTERAVWSKPDTRHVTITHWVLASLIALLALALRLRDPLSSPIIGAEDPYLHIERTWGLTQGQWPGNYPVGFTLLLAPFTLFGPEAFYQIARFLPAVGAAVLVFGTFVFTRNYMMPSGALTASLFAALMPELIRRTNLLFPTTFDLAVLPFIFFFMFRLVEGQRWAVYALSGTMVGVLFVHPWLVALLVPTLGLFGLIILLTQQEKRTWATSGSVAGVVGIVGLLFLFQQWKPSGMLLGSAIPKMSEVLGNPAIVIQSPPLHVDLPAMLTWPALGLAVVGSVFSLINRNRLGFLALLWTFMLLPLTVVNWFGDNLWYIPHRTVAYMAVGVAILAGIAVAEIVHRATQNNAKARIPATVGALAVVCFLCIPSSLAVDPWYRIYQDDDFQAFYTLTGINPDYVMCGSWQSRAGYRSISGSSADYNPDFFKSPDQRNVTLQEHPGLYVIVDEWTTLGKLDTSFLKEPKWQQIGQWGNVTVWRHRT